MNKEQKEQFDKKLICSIKATSPMYIYGKDLPKLKQFISTLLKVEREKLIEEIYQGIEGICNIKK